MAIDNEVYNALNCIICTIQQFSYVYLLTLVSTVKPHLSNLIGTWVCLDSQKRWIIEPITELHSNTLIKHTLQAKHS